MVRRCLRALFWVGAGANCLAFFATLINPTVFSPYLPVAWMAWYLTYKIAAAYKAF